MPPRRLIDGDDKDEVAVRKEQNARAREEPPLPKEGDLFLEGQDIVPYKQNFVVACRQLGGHKRNSLTEGNLPTGAMAKKF